MSGRVQAEIEYDHLTSGVETVRESDSEVEKSDVESALHDYVAKRRAEHPEWYADEPQDTTKVEASDESQESQEKPAEAAEESQEAAEAKQAGITDPESEPESKALSRVLQREAKLREDKAAFKQEQEEFKTQLAEFQRAQQLAQLDPVGYLKTLGVSQEDLIKVAESAYYESLGELAPDQYKGQKESLALKQKVQELEKRLEEATAQPQRNEAEEALRAYQESMIEATKTFDTEQYSAVAKIVDAYGEHAVAADMYSVAEEYAQRMQGQGQPLTPEQCMAEVNARYQKFLEKLLPAQERKKQAVSPSQGSKKQAKKTLSNKLSSNVPPEKPLEGMSYEEVVAAARANFQKSLSGGDK